MALSADGTTLVSADGEGLGVWDLNTGTATARRDIGNDAVGAAAVDGDGTVGITANAKGAIHLWRLHRSDQVRVTRMTEEGTAGRFALVPDSRSSGGGGNGFSA